MRLVRNAARLLFLILLSAALLVSFCGCGLFNDDVSRERIVKYVTENREKLEAFPEDGLPDERAAERAYIRKALGSKTIVKSVYRYNGNILKFYCGGTGLSVNSTYSGFYYSADDSPFALEFPTDELRETSPGIFEWKTTTGEEYITERICPCWFYYHMIWY